MYGALEPVLVKKIVWVADSVIDARRSSTALGLIYVHVVFSGNFRVRT